MTNKQVTYTLDKKMVEHLEGQGYRLLKSKTLKDGRIHATFEITVNSTKGGQRPQSAPVSTIEVEGSELMIRSYQMRGYKLVAKSGSMAVMEK